MVIFFFLRKLFVGCIFAFSREILHYYIFTHFRDFFYFCEHWNFHLVSVAFFKNFFLSLQPLFFCTEISVNILLQHTYFCFRFLKTVQEDINKGKKSIREITNFCEENNIMIIIISLLKTSPILKRKMCALMNKWRIHPISIFWQNIVFVLWE